MQKPKASLAQRKVVTRVESLPAGPGAKSWPCVTHCISTCDLAMLDDRADKFA